MSKEGIVQLMNAVIEDEYDDRIQNQDPGIIEIRNPFMDFFLRNRMGNPSLDIGCGSGDLLAEMRITHAVEPHPVRYDRAREQNPTVDIQQAWAETLPFNNEKFHTVVSWGTFMFIRSMPEALYEVNRVLTLEGRFIFDVVTHTTMPIAQTVNPRCFPKYVELFGFSLVEKRRFGWRDYQRIALCVEKISRFDYRELMMPFCQETISNFCGKRDWFMGKGKDIVEE